MMSKIQEKTMEGYKETELGVLPESWKVVKIGDLAEVKYGKTKPKTEGDIPVVGSGGIYAKTDKPLVDFQTIVIGRKGTAGKTWLFFEPCYPSDTTFYLKWKKEVDVSFIYNYMTLNPLSGEHAKTTLPSLQKPDLENYLIPFPLLSEQQKIAYVLSSIQESKEKTENIINTLIELKKSTMKHLFTYGPVEFDEIGNVKLKETEIGNVPYQWKESKVRDHSDILTGGTPKTEIKSYWEPQEIPWMKSGEIQGHPINSVSTYISKNGLENSNARWLPKKSVVIALAGRGKTRGTTAPLEFDCTCNQSVVCIKPDENISYLYLHYYLSNLYSYIRRLTGDKDRSGLNKQLVGNIPLYYPTIEIQHQIGDMLSSVDKKVWQERNKKIALGELFKSMLHNLMTAKIRVNNLKIERDCYDT